MVAHSSEGHAVMEILNQRIEEAAVGLCLKAGDLIIIDNRRTVHARTEFEPRYDGFDRWLQRSYVVDSLAPSAVDRKNDRIIRTQFSV
jgi:L-asparagine oxygenase